MKVLLVVVIAIVAAATAQRMSYSLNALDWSTPSVVMQVFPVATKKDLLAYIAFPTNEPVVSLRRRNSEGEYELVGNFSNPTSPLLGTNGKWVAMIETNAVLFNIDENNQVSAASEIPVIAADLLSDDTVVGFDPVSELGDGNYSIRSYEYDAANNNWNEIPGTEVTIPFPISSQLGIVSFHATDTHLVIVDPIATSIRIYERQADLSWDLTETVPVNNTETLGLYGVRYNGVDTLVYSAVAEDGDYIGIVFIYTKINGEWVEQTFTGSSLGLRPILYLGLVVTFIDADNMLLSAGFEGYDGVSEPSRFGKVLYVTRSSNTGLWEPAVDLTGGDIFGLGVGVNDYDIVVPSYQISSDPILTFYTAPRCFADPINVTCNNQQVTDCSQVLIDELYTINNLQCGAVAVSVDGFRIVDNQEVSARLTFSRGYGADVTCNATTTCPAPPVTSIAPVGSTPAGSPAKVSSANVLRIGVATIFLYAFAVLV